jgi:leucyl aminopeptidase
MFHLRTRQRDSNHAGRRGGASGLAQRTSPIIGALYLAEFVSTSTRWAHLDIMAANPAAKPGRPEGGEATGMRALCTYIRQRYA